MILEQVDHKLSIRARSVYRDFLTDFPVKITLAFCILLLFYF